MLKFFGRLLELHSTNPAKYCKQIFFFAKQLICNAFFLQKTNGQHADSITYENMRDLTGKFRHECQNVLLHVQSCTNWENSSRTNSPKFKFFTEFGLKTLSRAVKLPFTFPEEFLEEKIWNYKKTVSILIDKLSDFEQIPFASVANTALYESIGTLCEKYLQETMSYYLSFLQFWSNKISVWCWNCILRVQRKSLTSFFRNFREHFPDFEQPFLRKNARTGFFVISDTFCKKRQNLQF